MRNHHIIADLWMNIKQYLKKTTESAIEKTENLLLRNGKVNEDIIQKRYMTSIENICYSSQQIIHMITIIKKYHHEKINNTSGDKSITLDELSYKITSTYNELTEHVQKLYSNLKTKQKQIKEDKIMLQKKQEPKTINKDSTEIKQLIEYGKEIINLHDNYNLDPIIKQHKEYLKKHEITSTKYQEYTSNIKNTLNQLCENASDNGAIIYVSSALATLTSITIPRLQSSKTKNESQPAVEEKK